MNPMHNADVVREVARYLNIFAIARLFATFCRDLQRAILAPYCIPEARLPAVPVAENIGRIHYLLLHLRHITSVEIKTFDYVSPRCLTVLRLNAITSLYKPIYGCTQQRILYFCRPVATRT